MKAHSLKPAGIAFALCAVTALMSRPDPPTGLFTAQNLITLGALRALRRLGLERTVAVVGFDDFPLADLVSPGSLDVTSDGQTVVVADPGVESGTGALGALLTVAASGGTPGMLAGTEGTFSICIIRRAACASTSIRCVLRVTVGSAQISIVVRSGPIPASASAAATLTFAGKPRAASRAVPEKTRLGSARPVTVMPFSSR